MDTTNTESTNDHPVRIGLKTLDILRMAALPVAAKDARREHFESACHRYAPKAVRVKVAELSERGYLEFSGTVTTISTAWLTDKGRRTLEHHVLID